MWIGVLRFLLKGFWKGLPFGQFCFQTISYYPLEFFLYKGGDLWPGVLGLAGRTGPFSGPIFGGLFGKNGGFLFFPQPGSFFSLGGDPIPLFWGGRTPSWGEDVRPHRGFSSEFI